MVQRDMISEQRLAAIVGGDKELRDRADQLIDHASCDYTVKAFWITAVTGICPQSVAALAEEGAFRRVNVGTREKPHWRYDIVSFLSWYKSRVDGR